MRFLEKIDDSPDLALDNDVSDVIITGDFNLSFLDSASRNKLLSIVNQYSLCQIIDKPTHFTETSSSIIDLFFTSNPDTVIVNGVGEVKRWAMIRNWYNQIPYPALKTKREITKYIKWRQFTKGTRGKQNEQLFPK